MQRIFLRMMAGDVKDTEPDFESRVYLPNAHNVTPRQWAALVPEAYIWVVRAQICRVVCASARAVKRFLHCQFLGCSMKDMNVYTRVGSNELASSSLLLVGAAALLSSSEGHPGVRWWSTPGISNGKKQRVVRWYSWYGAPRRRAEKCSAGPAPVQWTRQS